MTKDELTRYEGLMKEFWVKMKDADHLCDEYIHLRIANDALFASLKEMVSAYECSLPGDCNAYWHEDYNRATAALAMANDKTHNVKVRGCALAQSQPEGRT